jgi:hypothetical protein
MKRLSLLLVLLFVSATSSADSIKLTSGSGQIYPLFVLPGFVFQFNGEGHSISIPQALDDYGGDLANCMPCFGLPPLGSRLFIASGGILAGNNPYLTGSIAFDAISFSSSLAPSGIVTVRYTATASLTLYYFDSVTGTQSDPFIWGSPAPWLITAQFRPDVGLPGVYEFVGATLVSTPEPGSMVLLGTGLLPLGFGVRRRLSRCAHGPDR